PPVAPVAPYPSNSAVANRCWATNFSALSLPQNEIWIGWSGNLAVVKKIRRYQNPQNNFSYYLIWHHI
ncbi:hypothetical protein, partial [Paenibacillus odorifer]|uniref:hypothetical protein n=1 Tax=Paenibacillus odorifer TaxID=189426 RepID=UPI001C376F13